MKWIRIAAIGLAMVTIAWTEVTDFVKFNLSGPRLQQVFSTLVFGREGFSAVYRLHNDGPDIIDVVIVSTGEKPTNRRHFALGAGQTIDLSMGNDDLQIKLPDGGVARGWYKSLKL
jgi:hypothetical protein